jgi:hypothetical protein
LFTVSLGIRSTFRIPEIAGMQDIGDDEVEDRDDSVDI